MSSSFNLEGHNEYQEEILHRKHQLKAYSQFQGFMEAKQLIIDLESQQRRKYLQESERLKGEVERMEEMHHIELVRVKEVHQAEIMALKAEISQLRTSMGVAKTTSRQKELTREIDRLQQELKEYLQQLEKNHIEIAQLKSYNLKSLAQMETAKKQYEYRETRTTKDASHTQKLELESQELFHKIKLLKQELNDQIQINNKARLKLDEAVEICERLKDDKKSRVSDLEAERNQCLHDNTVLQKELALARKDIQYLQKQLERQENAPKKLQEPWSEEIKRRRTSRERERQREREDPERMSPIAKKLDQKQTFPSLEHHCLCTRSERFRKKLKQANQKIVDLLAEKCRRNIETSFNTKTSKRNPNSTLDL